MGYLLATILAVITLGFSIRFLWSANHEFLIYVVVILVVAGLIAATFSRVRYSFVCLVGLAIWAVLHLAGGGIRVNDDVLYGLILIPISDLVAGRSDGCSLMHSILRYDQVVHAFGFGVATLVMYQLLANLLPPRDMKRFSVGLVTVMAGCGLGALNENIEFLLTVLLPQTGVGGYENTSLDLCSNLFGAVCAYLLVRTGVLSIGRRSCRV